MLKIWMSFEVVLDHYADWKSLQSHCLNNILYSYGQLAVPIFMLLAFLLTDVHSLASDTKKIRSRFYRLCVPQIFWTFLYYFVYKITDRIYGTGLLHGKSDIFWQLICKRQNMRHILRSTPPNISGACFCNIVVVHPPRGAADPFYRCLYFHPHRSTLEVP